MSTHPVSTPTFPGALRRFGTSPFVVGVGATLLLVGLVALGLYTRSSGDSVVPRAPEVGVVSPAPAWSYADSVNRSGWSYYVVGTDQQAMTLEASLAESDAVRHAVGEPVLLESVYVAGSDAEAAAFAGAVAEGNLALVALGLGEDRVVDLRGD